MSLLKENELNALLAKYVGGQMEIQVQSPDEIKILRGEIKTIAVKNGELHTEFAWLAKMAAGNAWISQEDLHHKMDFLTGYVNNIGPSGKHIGGDDRLQLGSRSNSKEFVILFPANGSKLDPARVEGLRLQQT